MAKRLKGERLSMRRMSGWLLIAGIWAGGYAGAAAGAAAAAQTAPETPGPVQADSGSYAKVWGPPAGSPLPMLAAQDQDGQPRRLEDLVGRQGLLLFLHRSADW